MAITVKHSKVSTIPDDADTSLVRPSDWNADHTLTGTVPVANGGTGVSTSSGANSVVLRDANANITTNCLFEGFSSQAASGTTIVLVASSVQNWQITGSGGQIIRLPDATTLPNGATFTFNNNQSSGAITVQNNSSTTVATINSGGYVTVVLLSNSIAAGSWDKHDSTPSNVSWSTNTLDYAGSITSATWNGTAVAINRGGTGASTLAGASIVTYTGAETLTNKWVQPRVLASTANSATPTLNTDNYDMMVITSQSVAITSFTTNLTGTPVNGQKLIISITGTGAIAITWGASFESSTVTLPSTTVTTNRLDIGFIWNVATSKWRCVASA
jgi:hypothetical protein